LDSESLLKLLLQINVKTAFQLCNIMYTCNHYKKYNFYFDLRSLAYTGQEKDKQQWYPPQCVFCLNLLPLQEGSLSHLLWLLVATTVISKGCGLLTYLYADAQKSRKHFQIFIYLSSILKIKKSQFGLHML
jgi:hypothetical protein